MKESILKSGWTDSSIRLMPHPSQEGKYLCIDGMHRVEVLKQLILTNETFKNINIKYMIYPYLKEWDQCLLAECK